jgi:hypothetical protein
MNQRSWERPVCILCDYWWGFLIFLVLGVAAYFLRGYLFPNQEPLLHTGDVQATLRWEGLNDLDLHVISPNAERIYYAQSRSTDGGELDVDSNAGCGGNITKHPVENIFWPTGGAPRGEFQVLVVYYAHCERDSDPTSFTVTVKVDGKTETFRGSVSGVGEEVQVYTFTR